MVRDLVEIAIDNVREEKLEDVADRAELNAEERLLREHFGAEYDAYFTRTWRLIPGLY